MLLWSWASSCSCIFYAVVCNWSEYSCLCRKKRFLRHADRKTATPRILCGVVIVCFRSAPAHIVRSQPEISSAQCLCWIAHNKGQRTAESLSLRIKHSGYLIHGCTFVTYSSSEKAANTTTPVYDFIFYFLRGTVFVFLFLHKPRREKLKFPFCAG